MVKTYLLTCVLKRIFFKGSDLKRIEYQKYLLFLCLTTTTTKTIRRENIFVFFVFFPLFKTAYPVFNYYLKFGAARLSWQGHERRTICWIKPPPPPPTMCDAPINKVDRTLTFLQKTLFPREIKGTIQ